MTLPDALAVVLREYRSLSNANPDGWLFTTRNNRPPSSNKVVEYRLWPIIDALDIPRCGLHAFRHSVASFIVDADYSPEVAKQQLRHTDARTTLNYIHLRGGITEQAMTDVANSPKLDVVGRNSGKPVYSVGYIEADVGSIPIARSISLDDSIVLTRLSR